MSSSQNERDIDEELKKMWHSVMAEHAERLKVSTQTKVRAIVDKHFGKRLLAMEEKQNEHSDILAAVKRGILNIAGSFGKK